MRAAIFSSLVLFALAAGLSSSACGSNENRSTFGGEGGLGGDAQEDGGGSIPGRPKGSGGKSSGGEGGETGSGGATTLYCGDQKVSDSEECEPPGVGSCGIDCLWLPAICGNEVREEGEECDPPNGETCSDECKSLRIECGNAVVQAEEECDPPNNKTCSDNCTRIVCGDFKREGTEECDPPNGRSCDTKCRNIRAVCGDTIVQPGEECDPPNGKSCGKEVFMVGAPAESAIGSDIPISINVEVNDPDGDEVFFSWRVTSGEISDTESLDVIYSCTEVGAQTIEIQVRDSAPACVVAQTLVPYCYEAE
jgi:hypothetical protein